MEIWLILFILGLAIGSFLNVVILRYSPEISVFSFNKLKGRSKCPKCKKSLKWYELIPLVSFLVQLGRCRNCKEKISYQYPIVEFLTGTLFAVVPWFLYNFYSINKLSVDINEFVFYGLCAVWLVIFSILIVITWIDRRHYIIPNELNLTLLGLGALVVYLKEVISVNALPFTSSFVGHFHIIFSLTRDIITNHILGFLVAGLFFLFLILVSGGKAMGWGDVKFAFATGLILGWPDIALSIAIAFIIGGIVGAFVILFDSKSLKDKLPFAPFLALGVLLTFFFGADILSFYLGFIGV